MLHLACHGLFRSDNPSFSGVRLADGWLFASEVTALDLATGKPKWKKDVPGGVVACAAIADGLVVCTATDGKVRAYRLALRKRFCVSFNFELQAAATDNGLVLSLTDQHSFPLELVFSFLSLNTVDEVLRQALLASPMFGARWKWNASRALAVPRFQGGRKVPPPLQRMRSDDLLAAVFPDQAACAENLTGEIRIPDHPLVKETIDNCLHEAMDLSGLRRILDRIGGGSIRTESVEYASPNGSGKMRGYLAKPANASGKLPSGQCRS